MRALSLYATLLLVCGLVCSVTASVLPHAGTRRLSAFVLDIRNADAYLAGAKPQLVEVGPFVYDVIDAGTNLTYPQPNEHKIIPGRTYMFNLALSVSSDSVNVTTLNTPFLSIAHHYMNSGEPGTLEYLFSHLGIYSANTDAVRLFSFRTVREVLFGWRDPVMQLLEQEPYAPLSNSTCMWLFDGQANRTYERTLWRSTTTTQRCSNGASLCQCLPEDRVPLWGTAQANLLRGGAGEVFPAPVSASTLLGVWVDDLSRFVPLEPVDAQSPSQFRVQSSVWQNASEVPQNAAYYQERTLLGLLNYTSVASFPLYLSQPRFIGADPTLTAAIHAAWLPSPVDADVTSLWNVDPVTGVTTSRRLNSMLSYHPRPLEGNWSSGGHPGNFSWFPMLVPVHVPAYWFAEEWTRQAPNTSCVFASENALFNFSDLATATGTVVQSAAGDEFLVNVCGMATGAQASFKMPCFDAQASVCYRPAGGSDWSPIARLQQGAEQPQYSLIIPNNPSGGVRARYSNGLLGDTGSAALMDFLFFCATGVSPATTYSAFQNTTTGIFTVVVTSPIACQQVAPGTSSTGVAASSTGGAAPVPNDVPVDMLFKLWLTMTALPGGDVAHFVPMLLQDIATALEVPTSRLQFTSVAAPADAAAATLRLGSVADANVTSQVEAQFRILAAPTLQEPTASLLAAGFVWQCSKVNSALFAQQNVTRFSVIGSARIVESPADDGSSTGIPGWGIALLVIASLAFVALVAVLAHVCHGRSTRTELRQGILRAAGADDYQATV